MSQCVPSWDVDDSPTVPPKLTLRAQSYSNSLIPDVPMLDYEVAELTWKNGQIAMHGLGPPRVPTTWEKPRAGGTLESLVNQATRLPQLKSVLDGGGGGADELVPWFEHKRASGGAAVSAATASATMTMDALVPCSNRSQEPSMQVLNSVSMSGMGTCVVGCSTRVGSCSEAATWENRRDGEAAMKRAGGGGGVERVAVAAHEWSSRDSGSATFGRDSRQVTLDTCENSGLNVGGFTSTSMGSPENTSSGKQSTKATTADDHDFVCHSRRQRGAGDEGGKKRATGKVSVSTKRSRAAAIHNQSERKRRDKINQRMKTLQKMVPNSSKTDKASMLDEVIEYLKQLQAQVHVMSRVNMSPMMLPMTLQQQLQMSMMAPVGMGMGMRMGMGVMDMNSIAHPNIAGITPAVLHPTAFMPLTSWEGTGGDKLSVPASLIPDPLSTFLACQSQSQPMTMEAYSRMAALYQHMQQQPSASGSKN